MLNQHQIKQRNLVLNQISKKNYQINILCTIPEYLWKIVNKVDMVGIVVSSIKKMMEMINKGDQGKRGEVLRVLQKLVYKSNSLVINMSESQLQGLIATIQQYFESQVLKFLDRHKCKRFQHNVQIYLAEKVDLFKDYLQISNAQSMKIFEVSPFLLCTSLKKLRGSILEFYNSYKYTNEQIVQLMKIMGEAFLLGAQTLKLIHNTPRRWGLGIQQTKNMFMKHPILFYNYPFEIMTHKRDILKYLNFTQSMGLRMLREYPQILIWSVRSMQQKALFIVNRLQLTMDNSIIELLAFNFNQTLRPRGQLLIRGKRQFNKQNIIHLMKISNQQFSDQVNIPLERLEKQLKRFPITQQLDFKSTRVGKYIGLKQKIRKLAQSYRQH